MGVDALVLDLDTRGGLAVARSLGRAGLRVVVGAHDPQAPGLHTRYAVARAVLPPPEVDFDAYADAIRDVAAAHGATAVVPCIDSSVMALHRRRDEIAGGAVGSPAAVETAVSKPRTLEVAASLGIPAPRSIAARTPDDVDAAARELGLPVVVKPEESWRDEGGGGERLYPHLAETVEQLREARLLAPAVVQELAPGVRETIKLFRVDGRVLARFAMRIDRTWPPLGGSSVHRESVEPPSDLVERSEALVGAIGLDGYSEVEFRRDARGEPLLMEVNPRLSQSVELAIRAGLDFARMQTDWARGREVAPVSSYRVGVRLGWVAGELLLARTSRPPLVDYLRGKTAIEGLDLRDPAPLGASVGWAARALLRRL